jgi:hypothetical protein
MYFFGRLIGSSFLDWVLIKLKVLSRVSRVTDFSKIAICVGFRNYEVQDFFLIEFLFFLSFIFLRFNKFLNFFSIKNSPLPFSWGSLRLLFSQYILHFF